MRSIGNLRKNLAIVALLTTLCSGCAMANTLNEIEVNSIDSGYGIVLKADEATQIKKTISTSDKLSIEIKDINVSEDFNTVYNNVADIDNVTVTQTEKGGIKVTLKGKDVANSKITFATTKIASNITPVQAIELSAPISTFTPVYKPEMFEVEENITENQTANPQLNEVLTKMHITKSMLITAKTYAKKIINKTKSGDMNMLTLMGIIFVIAAFALRPSRKQATKSMERPSLSNMLAQQTRTPQLEREIYLNKSMVNSMDLRKNNSLTTTPINSGYGMKAYQQSQRNPYTTNVQSTNGVSGIARRKPLQATAPIKKAVTTNRPVSTKVNTPIKPKAPSMINPVAKQPTKQATSPEAEMDSMKFLESITKIYEKNGRADLAKGLQDNLKKAQMSQKLAV